ncbi:hypothetical protein Glove_120g112 [Diversispora epigaea]|uniref:Uncharacterized protein n=1 Tax=Diversispora epigaea TaxID=1348612 RepID=A0A397J8W7_9GLOM|nr:hypothetical protein Glove_120g112 [Diversispora epigaea]
MDRDEDEESEEDDEGENDDDENDEDEEGEDEEYHNEIVSEICGNFRSENLCDEDEESEEDDEGENDDDENDEDEEGEDEEYHNEIVYKRPDTLQRFIDKLEEELEEIQANLMKPTDIIMETGDYKRHQTVTKYWICEKKFLNQTLFKTMICCLNTGNYIGGVHQRCKQRNEIIGLKWYQQSSI